MASSPSASAAVLNPARGAGSGLDLHLLGLRAPGPVHANLSPPALTEAALARHEGFLSKKGAFVAYTGAHTGRSPKDRFVVSEPHSRDEIWWGSINRPMVLMVSCVT